MEIEFDPDKDATNIAKHRISLARAADLLVIAFEMVARNREVRIQALGTIEGEYYSLTFVFRRNAMRAISLRRSRQKEIDQMSRKKDGLAEDGVVFGDNDIIFDDDNPEWTAERIARARPASELPPAILAAFPKTLAAVRGAQKAPTKVPVSLRLSQDVVAHYKSTGPGWQTRIDDALRDAIKKAG